MGIRNRKDSFRITQVVDSGSKLSDAIDEMDELQEANEPSEVKARIARIGSVDSGLTTKTKVTHLPTKKQSNNVCWKQLNEGLNHIFPNLAVIRGNKLVADFALVIYQMDHMVEVGLTG